MTVSKGWQVFQIYNIYRVLLIVCLISYRYLDLSSNYYNVLLNADAYLVFMSYAFLVLFFIRRTHLQIGRFDVLVAGSAFIDLFFLNIFILYVGTLEHGVGVLLNIAIAALGISLPGIIPIVFAASESLVMIAYAYYQAMSWGSLDIYYAGIHGVGFFTTAITSLILAHWVKNINELADKRRLEIVSLQELNRHVIEKINAAIILITQNTKPVFLNEIARRWFNVKQDCFPASLMELSKELDEYVSQYFKGEVSADSKLPLKSTQKLLTIMPYGMAENASAVLIIEDAKALLAQAQQLKLASLGRFTASIAHELRNPLSAISHASQILQSSNKLTQQELRFNEIIAKNCDRMNKLIKNVLQLSRQEPSKPSVIGLSAFLKQFIGDNKIHHNMHISLHEEDKNMDVLFDASQLAQLLVILFDNAWIYGKNEKGQALLHLVVKERSENTVSLLVSDEGAGIAEDKKDDIFEPFFTTSRQGNGLGLFLAKELCIANKAKIDLIDNENGQGACFEIILLRPRQHDIS